jgi:NADH-quinone oxidoreductase subunit G
VAKVIIDDQEIEIGDSERLNGIEAARRIGVEIPHYCWHPGLSVVASCRMCLVETGSRDPKSGNIVMLPKLVPACQTPARDGTVFKTDTEAVKRSRAQVEEYLLIDHPIDCPICDKAGECSLQDYHFQHGQKERRADLRPFSSRRRDVGPTVTLFVDRCVMCTRCVRFTREISGTSELMVTQRGTHEEIDVFPRIPLDNKLAGNVVDLCPVGALGDKDFLYRQRVWFMKRHAGVCTGCSTGCSIWIEENQDRVWRIKPRENPHVNQWWICDDGRYGYHHVHHENRLAHPRRRLPTNGQPADDPSAGASWPAICNEVPKALASAGRLAGVFSPFLTVEEAWLLASFLRGIDPQAELAMGMIPIAGQDERFPAGFTIRGEKCPNRRGVEEVLRHFTGSVASFDDVLCGLDDGRFQGAWVSGGYSSTWIDESTARRFDRLKALVVQDLFPSPLGDRAGWLLPGAAFSERPGSYVNASGRLQTADWAVRPPAGAWSEGWLLWRLVGRTGLYQPGIILEEIAAAIGSFAPAAGGVPPEGVPLAAAESVT